MTHDPSGWTVVAQHQAGTAETIITHLRRCYRCNIWVAGNHTVTPCRKFAQILLHHVRAWSGNTRLDLQTELFTEMDCNVGQDARDS